jgi:AcrR family transcriptional regulator
MTRTVDLANRAELLERVAAYVVAHGVSDLSLRPLATAVGVSPRTLLYHFGSKEAIVTAVFKHLRATQITVFEELKRADVTTPGAACRAAWTYMTAPEIVSKLTLFFETYALAVRDPRRFPGFLDSAIEDWLAFLSSPLCARGLDPLRARTVATIVLAGYRGFMLDFVATGDRVRIGAALDAWVDALEPLYENGESHAQPA